MPVRLYHGQIDDRVPLHHAQHLVSAIRECRLTVYPGEGHMIIFEHAEQFLDTLAD